MFCCREWEPTHPSTEMEPVRARLAAFTRIKLLKYVLPQQNGSTIHDPSRTISAPFVWTAQVELLHNIADWF